MIMYDLIVWYNFTKNILAFCNKKIAKSRNCFRLVQGLSGLVNTVGIEGDIEGYPRLFCGSVVFRSYLYHRLVEKPQWKTGIRT